MLPQLSGVVHDNNDDDLHNQLNTIGPDDDNIGADPPDHTPIEQEDPRELKNDQPLATNNEQPELIAMGVHPNFATANEHVPEIERQITVLKERARACPNSLPFTYLPRFILIEVMLNTSLWVNVFPPKGGVSTLSPRSLITGIKFDYTKHCQISIGSYAQVHKENQPTNTQQPQTIGTICLGPTGRLQGGYKLYNLTP